MKAISLWQPWASAIAFGLKHYETRSWETSYRGPIAIHAAKRSSANQRRVYSELKLEHLIASKFGYRLFGELPFGQIIATAMLSKCMPTSTVSPDTIESLLGDFSFGRFAWRLESVRIIWPGIPCIGRQGLFEWTVPIDREGSL